MDVDVQGGLSVCRSKVKLMPDGVVFMLDIWLGELHAGCQIGFVFGGAHAEFGSR